MTQSTTRLGFLPASLFLFAFCAAQLAAQNAATSVSVDANASRHAINPDIYGLSAAGTADIAALNAPLNRAGGNEMSEYNWQIDALNKASDWYWESYLQEDPLTPGKSIDDFIQGTHAANVGSQPAITIPMLPYIAKLGPKANSNAASIWSFSVAKYGAQTGADPYQPDAGNGVSAATGKNIVNDPNDAYVPNTLAIQEAWLKHLIGKWGLSTTATGVRYYVLDNEPSLWNSTHRDVHPDLETYEELYNDIVANAGAIRAADPNAKIVAPEEWTWWAMYLSALDQKNGTGAGSDYATHNNTYYYPWLLQQLYAHEQSTGVKLIDALSVHCYNQAPGDGDDSDSQAARNKETRILWDPNFVDPSWEGTVGINGGVEDWIPTLRNWVNKYYPGLEIGCTEYNWGDENALNGATTQADVEGIYGAYGLDLATRWTVPEKPTYLAMQMYRNYDGKLSVFGDTSVADTVVNPDNLSSFAAVRTSDGALTAVVINKQHGSTPVTVSLANFGTTGTAQAYQISSATQASIASIGSVTVENNEIGTTVPSQSITLFVIPEGGTITKPTAPAGLTAIPGSGTVELTWLATGGASSYSVQRSTSSTGKFSPIGTVTSPARTTFTDTGLTNGTTYYYEISGTNKIGTGPNSAPVAATPQIPPAFTASATAAPVSIAASASSTVSFSVKDTGGALSNAIVEIQVFDTSGVASGYQVYSGQNFTAGGTLQFKYTWDPSKLAPPVTLNGKYTVAIGVFNSSWSTDYYWNGNAASITLTGGTSPPAFTASASPSPVSIIPTGSSTIAFTVKDTGGALSNTNVEIQLFNASSVACGYAVYSGQNFTAGGTLQFKYTWTPSKLSPPVTSKGPYTVAIGVFNAAWSTDYYWNGNAATVTIAAATAPATLTSPKPNAGTLLGADPTFKWTSGTGVTSYKLYLGITGVGADDLYNSGSLPATSTGVSVTKLPSDGVTVYARLYSMIDGVWKYIDYTYKESGTPALATLTSPKPNAETLLGADPTFKWTPGAGVTAYELYLGITGVGSDDLYNSGSLPATSTSVSVTKLPSDGVTVYARLLSKINGAWKYIDYTYKESGTPAPATLTSPKPNAGTLLGADPIFKWTPGAGVTAYKLWLGTTGVGSDNLFNSGNLPATSTGVSVTGLPSNGVTVYARLYSMINGAWQGIDYTYKESK